MSALRVIWPGGGNVQPGEEFTDKIKVKCKIPQIFAWPWWPGDSGRVITDSPHNAPFRESDQRHEYLRQKQTSSEVCRKDRPSHSWEILGMLDWPDLIRGPSQGRGGPLRGPGSPGRGCMSAGRPRAPGPGSRPPCRGPGPCSPRRSRAAPPPPARSWCRRRAGHSRWWWWWTRGPAAGPRLKQAEVSSSLTIPLHMIITFFTDNLGNSNIVYTRTVLRGRLIETCVVMESGACNNASCSVPALPVTWLITAALQSLQS